MKKWKAKDLIIIMLICAAAVILLPTHTFADPANPLTVTPSFSGGNTAAAYAIRTNNSYNLTFDLVGSGLADPTLQIKIPKGITLSYYPTASNAILSPLLAATNPVSQSVDAEGNTILIYKFKSEATAIGFNITLTPTYKLDETTYTVNTKYLNGATEIQSVDSNVTISENPCFNNNIAQFQTNKSSSLLLEGVPDYYVPFNGNIYMNDSDHYSFDELSVVIPISDDAVPGFGQGAAYVPFVSGVSNNVTAGGVVAYSVTYYDNYSFKNAANIVMGTGRALVMTLPSGHPLTSSQYSGYFSDNIYFKYTIDTEKVSSKFLRPQMTAKAGSNNYILMDYVNYTGSANYFYYCIGCEFKTFHIADYLYLTNSSTATCGHWQYVLPLENNSTYISYVTNKLGETVQNCKIVYDFSKELYPNKVTFNLISGSSGTLPTQATVKYKTFKGGDTIYTQNMNSDQKSFELSDPTDAIVYMEVLFDRIGNSIDQQELLRTNTVNRESLAGVSKTVNSQIISAESNTYGTTTTFPTVTSTLYLQQRVYISAVSAISPTTLNKGDDFNVLLRTTDYPAMVKNPAFYVVMPKGYVYMGYTPPGGTAYAGAEYTVTTRDLGSNMLYIVKYTDNVERYSYYTDHVLRFKVGPSVPTTTVQNLNLPVALYVENNAPEFPFYIGGIYAYTDINDYNANGSTTDTLYKSNSSTNVTLNAVSAMTAQGFLTTSITAGENTDQEYRYDSAGTYKYYMYNGLQAGNDASDLVIDIGVPRKGSSVTYNSATYNSSFDALLTGPPVLTGDMFEGAVITYKLVGSDDYVAGASGIWTSVAAIRVTTAAGKSLCSNGTAIIELPFEVSGYSNTTTTYSRAYFDAALSYKLTGSGSTVQVARTAPSALKPILTNITGTIYKDYNTNGVMDGEEISAPKPYTVSLYEGAQPTGTIKASAAVDGSTGRFTLGVINPGTYTLKVNKNSLEYYPTGTADYFDDNGCYTFTIGEGSSDVLSGLNLGLISPRTISCNFNSVTLMEGTPRTILPTLSPALQPGEGGVQYSSSDLNVVTVTSNGAITYVADGTAKITVTAPQFPAFAALPGASPTVSQEIAVTCRKEGCHVTAAPYAALAANLSSPSITRAAIELSPGAASTLRFYYWFNRGGYCNSGHSNTLAATWSILDAGGTDATMSATVVPPRTKYAYSTLSVSQPGTVILKCTGTWPHDEGLKPADTTVTVTVNRKQSVTLPSGTGYTASAYNSSSPVNYGSDYSFRITLDSLHDQSAIIVKENGNTLTPAAGIYTISNIREDKTVTVEGVTINTYSVSLNTNGGTISSGAITAYTAGVGATLPGSTDIGREGYVFNGWTETNDAADTTYVSSIGADATGNKVYYAKWTAIPAGGPSSITVDTPSLIYGYTEGYVTVSAIAAAGHTVSGYQWYSCDSSRNNEAVINGATGAALSLAAGMDVGTYHYFCQIASTRNDNHQTVFTDSGVAAVNIGKKVLTLTVTANNKVYDGYDTATGTVTLGGVLPSDNVTASAIFTFADFSVGTGRTVNVTNITLGGIDAPNYSATNSAITTADILIQRSSTKKNNEVSILVNGNAESAGTSTTSIVDNKETTTVKVDDQKVDEKLQAEGKNAVVTILITKGSEVVVGELNGQTVKNMEAKEAVLEIKTEDVTYTLPAAQINIDDVSAQMGNAVELKDISVKVLISVPADDTVRVMEDTADKNSYQLVVKPVEFSITCEKDGKNVEVSKFKGYVERMISIPAGVDPNKITTGVVLNADGTFSHVPTSIVLVNGKYYAKINSLTNSTYSVIYNPVEFADSANHWAKNAINNMGSRLVVSGMDKDTYEPDRDITRAEFAAIIMRALGLRPGTGESKFRDVRQADWYCGSVNTAFSYDIIKGYSASVFAPNEKITREQAMSIIARAMKLTGIDIAVTDSEVKTLLASYTDSLKVESYAKIGIAKCLKAGVITGRSANSIAPKENISRAEVAVIVEKMLQKSELINTL